MPAPIPCYKECRVTPHPRSRPKWDMQHRRAQGWGGWAGRDEGTAAAHPHTATKELGHTTAPARFAFYGHLCCTRNSAGTDVRPPQAQGRGGREEKTPKSREPSWQRAPCPSQGVPHTPPSPTRTQHTAAERVTAASGYIFFFFCCISYIIQFHILIGSASIEQLILKSFNTSETAMVI